MEATTTTDPTPLADFMAEVDAARTEGRDLYAYRIGCAATFGGGRTLIDDYFFSCFTLVEDGDWLMAVDNTTGREWTLEW